MAGDDAAVRAGVALLVHDLQRVIREAMERDGVDETALAALLSMDVQAIERMLTNAGVEIETLVRAAAATGVKLGGREVRPERR